MATTSTKMVKASGGDYTTLAAYEAGEQGDLVAADEIRQAECYASASETGVSAITIDGSTTDATRYMRIYTPLAERHKRTVASGYVLTKAAVDANPGLTLADDYLRIAGLAIDMNGGTGSNGMQINFNVAFLRISHCVVKANQTTAAGKGLTCGSAVTWYAWNNIVYGYKATGAGVAGIWNGGASSTAYLFNNTVIVDPSVAALAFNRVDGTVVAKNNLAQALSGTCFTGTFDAASTNNASSDATAPGSSPRNSQTFTFKNPDLQDFGLSQYDVAAKDYGVDLSADADLPFSDDINGMTRPVGSAWDIGAHEAGIISTDIYHYPSQ